MISRHPLNPILSAQNISGATFVDDFLPSVCQWKGQYYLAYRNDNFQTGSSIDLVSSYDGIHWNSEPVTLVKKAAPPHYISPLNFEASSYSFITGRPQIFAYDTSLFVSYKVVHLNEIITTTMVTTDLVQWRTIHSHNRNINIYHFPLYGLTPILFQNMPQARDPEDKFDVWFDDLSTQESTPQGVLSYRDVPYANMGLSLTSQPVPTSRGWLIVFKAAYSTSSMFTRNKISFVAGAALLDLANPWNVLGISKKPIMKPEIQYEIQGDIPIIFPCGVVLENSSELKIYYTPPSNVLCLATANLDDIIDACI